MGPVIEVNNLRKRYGSHVAVADVSFQVHQGEIFGLLGRNGAGKTTTVECLQGLRRADGGRVRVLGLDPQRHTQQLRRRIGCQLQEAALPDRLRVWEALDLFASLTSVETDWQVLMDQWGLADSGRPHSPACRAGSASACSWPWPWSTTPRWCSWTS
jgi:ABC-2 type transport system ATP-binding protein